MERLDEPLLGLQILAVDDEASNLLLLRRMLERAGYTRVATETDPSRAIQLFVELRPALVLLDLLMPGMDGLELMERLAPVAGGRSGIPFLVLTADATEETKRRALSSGARDFLTKPFSQSELLLRVRNLLEVQRLHEQLREHNAILERKLGERTRELDQAQLEILVHLALAAEARDDETQEHAWRIGRTCGLIAIALGLPESQIELVQRAAPLHDIGKIGIADAILLKPGKLTDAEFDEVKTHAAIGAEILSGSASPLLRVAERIALTHHEWWDGTGYPHRLRGEEIPLAGRIVAVADVFDALTHQRPYKKAWPVLDAVGEILSQSYQQFDARLVDAFATLDHPALLGRVTKSGPRANGSALRSPEQVAALV
jgi:putative two-component system response regulator